MRRLLIIAGSDSSGGAGLQRDLQVVSEHRARARSAITAVTAQRDHSVHQVQHMPADMVTTQIECALQDGVDAIKIGMLGTAATVRAVSAALLDVTLPIVIDPVLMSSSGALLLDGEGQDELMRLLAPRCALLTPNLMEAHRLLCGDARGDQKGDAANDAANDAASDAAGDAQTLAARLARRAGCSVLVKGGHDSGPIAIDWLAEGDSLTALEGPRLASQMRGTGCALSTAIALGLAEGQPMIAACRAGKDYVAQLLRSQ